MFLIYELESFSSSRLVVQVYKIAEIRMVSYEKGKEKFVCRFTGRMDTTASMSIEDELIDQAQHAGVPVVFDFTNLEYVASSFLRSCVKVARVTGSAKIKVVGASEEILRIFDMTGFGKLMDIQRS